MPTSRARTIAPILLILASACGSTTTPSPSGSYTGQWVGTTSQGTAFNFTVSPDQQVTTLTLAYNFGGCTGSATFTVAAAIANIPTAPVPVGSAAYQSGPAGTANRTLISFVFTSPSDAHGMVIFADYADCDPFVSATWTAARR